MNKKISIFIPSFETGGVENNAILYSKILIENNYDVDIVYSIANKEKFALINDKVNKIHIKSTFKIPFVHPRLLVSLNIIYDYYQYLKINKPNILVLSFQNSIIAIILCKVLNIKVIARIANHPNVINIEKSLVVKISQKLKNLLYRFATLVITNSNITSQEIRKLTKAETKTIYNPAFTPIIIDKAKEIIKDDIFNKIKGQTIITVGRLSYQKDFQTLIQAFNIVKDKLNCSLVIVGEGQYRQILEELIHKLNLENRVYLLGYKSNPYKYVAKCDLFVLSSLYEGLPNALIEAIAVGTPAVSTNCLSGPSEILLDGRGGDLVEVGNYKKLATTIFKNLKDKNYSKTKHKIAFDNLDRFSYETIEKEIIELMSKYA